MTALQTKRGRIDSHVHFWHVDQTGFIPISRGISALQRSFLPKDLKDEAHSLGVEQVVLVEAAPNVEETEFVLDLSKNDPFIAAVIGWVDLDLPVPQTESRIEQYQSYPKFRGIRSFSPGGFDGRWLSGENPIANYRWLHENGLSCEFLINCIQLGQVNELIKQISGFRPLINHGARPFVVTGELEPWAGEMRQLANDTEALCKVSALAERAGVEWTTDTLYPYVATLVDVFGPDRLMFGSNWPVMTIMATYRRWIDSLDEILQRIGLDDAAQSAIYSGTAKRFYRIQEN
ncbi:MAG: amidohydrolase family protein [Pseudomonadota bacterium]